MAATPRLTASAFVTACALSLVVGPACADTLFRVTEVVREHEVKPRTSTYVTRWQGDYYVADEGVTVTGWTRKPTGKPVPYDQPHHGHDSAGSDYTSFFHRLPDGLDVRVEYESFVMERHIVQTGPQTCTEQISLSLKPGHDFYEVRRTSNHEPMFESIRTYTVSKCEFPPLTS